RLVIKKGLGIKEKAGSRQALRPAILRVIETGVPEASDLAPDQDPVAIVRMLPSAPIIDMKFNAFESLRGLLKSIVPSASGPDAGDYTNALVEGTVSSAIAPIDRVVINEQLVSVTQSPSAGPGGLGPFRGTFTAKVVVGPQAETITAYAMDAVHHVSTISLAVYPADRV